MGGGFYDLLSLQTGGISAIQGQCMKHLSQEIKIVKVKAASAAGQTDIESDIVDTQDYEGVMFFVTAGTIDSSGEQSLKIEHGDESDLSDAADVAGSSVAIADDDDGQVFVTDYYDVDKRYCRATITRATADSAFGEIYALLYGAKIKPVSNNVTDVITTN